ncbi:MAG: glycoside hydrolase family 25 protein [Lachnospiraceae bacterium]|nr:glycoside hydrolase family 25 protein [Lachnospiraceae bacterium]
MDSRSRLLTILGSLSAVLLIVLIVVLCTQNGGTGNAISQDQGQVQTPVAVSQGPGEGRLIGNDPYGFMSDPTFFDEEHSDAFYQALDQSGNLSLMITSVEKDLRILVLDNNGELVTGVSFNVKLVDSSDVVTRYRDLDKDGIIYAGTLASGDYDVTLEPVEGYRVPLHSTRVTVKDKVEYIPIADISVLIKTEEEINAQLEDTASKEEATRDADRTEIVTLQAGGSDHKPGIDVSSWQGDIDWDKVRESGIEFVIVRAGYRGSVTGAIVKDKYFDANVSGALNAGLKVGVYFVTQAINEAEAVEEASAVMEMCSPYTLELPIYLDVEGSGGGRGDRIDVQTRTDVCEAFCRTLENAGQQGGVYACRNWLTNNIDASRLDRYNVWLAEYRSAPLYNGYYSMWQYTSKGHIDGINGNVDFDIMYY